MKAQTWTLHTPLTSGGLVERSDIEIAQISIFFNIKPLNLLDRLLL